MDMLDFLINKCSLPRDKALKIAGNETRFKRPVYKLEYLGQGKFKFIGLSGKPKRPL